MKKRTLLLLIAVAALSILQPGALFGNPVTVSAASTIYWGATLYGMPPDASNFQPGGMYGNFETNIAKKGLSIVAWGAPWEYPAGTMLKFQTTYFNNVRQHGSIPLLTWGSWSCCGAVQPKYMLKNVTRGDFDTFIRQWATDAKTWGHPFFLRFDHEMNGNWQFPWSVQLNGNTPADYINAWKHVHDIFKQVGANNAVWVWCPNISAWNTIPDAQVFPGNTYVDWICLDGYNFYKQQNMPWLSFSQIYSGDTKVVSNSKDSYTEITKLTTKPLMLGEFASVEAGDGGAKKAAWIKSALGTEIPTKYPRIRAIVWFNWNAGNANLSWPVESSSASQSAFAAAIASPIYAKNTFSGINSIP